MNLKAFTRNGYPVRTDLSHLFAKMAEKWKPRMEQHQQKAILLDGELMPWSAIGEGLIEHQFRSIEAAIDGELEFLEATNFDLHLKVLCDKLDASGFNDERARRIEVTSTVRKIVDTTPARKIEPEVVAEALGAEPVNLNKDQLYAKYGNRQARTYMQTSEYRKQHMPLQAHKEALTIYSRQLELYGKQGEQEFIPFAVLKMIMANGEELTCFNESVTNDHMYNSMNDEQCVVIDLDDPEAMSKARAYYDSVVADGAEGIVVKPRSLLTPPWCAPYLKVRNPDYLTLIYGYDYRFPVKYARLMRQKSVGGKLRTSVREWVIGRKLLEIKQSDITEKNRRYKHLLARMFAEEQSEKSLDPRL